MLFLDPIGGFLFQIQEKKVKRISEMNLIASHASGNGSVASSSMSVTSKAFIPNGTCTTTRYNCLTKDFSFPSEGFPSLRLPMVVVFNT